MSAMSLFDLENVMSGEKTEDTRNLAKVVEQFVDLKDIKIRLYIRIEIAGKAIESNSMIVSFSIACSDNV